MMIERHDYTIRCDEPGCTASFGEGDYTDAVSAKLLEIPSQKLLAAYAIRAQWTCSDMRLIGVNFGIGDSFHQMKRRCPKHSGPLRALRADEGRAPTPWF